MSLFCILLQIHYYVIITSLLHHYYVIITSLLHKAKLCYNESIITCSTLCVSIIMSLLRIITIITYYYVFETGQLADAYLTFCLCSLSFCLHLHSFFYIPTHFVYHPSHFVYTPFHFVHTPSHFVHTSLHFVHTYLFLSSLLLTFLQCHSVFP